MIESILFAAGEPVEKEEIISALKITPIELEALIRQIKERYESDDSGLALSTTENSLQLVTKPEYFDVVRHALKLDRVQKLSRAGAEVLALIAYRSPITRIEIDEIRGVNSSGALQRLIDSGLVCECGKKDVPGKPYLYETTDEFLRLAGIDRLTDLPDFGEFKV